MMVILHPADVTAAGGHNLVEECEAFVTAVGDATAVRFQAAAEHAVFAGVPATAGVGQRGPHGNAPQDFEMCMQLPVLVAPGGERGLGDLRQLPQQRAVDRRGHEAQVLQLGRPGRGVRDPGQQFLQHFDRQFRVKHPQALGQRSEGCGRDPQLATHRREAAGPLQVSQRGQWGGEE